MATDRMRRRIERLLDEADDTVSQFDRETVRNCAHAVLRLDPANEDAGAFLAAADREPQDRILPKLLRIPPLHFLRLLFPPHSPMAAIRSSVSWERVARRRSTSPVTPH